MKYFVSYSFASNYGNGFSNAILELEEPITDEESLEKVTAELVTHMGGSETVHITILYFAKL